MRALLIQAGHLLLADLRQEFRHAELLWSALFFSGVVLVILGLALQSIPEAAQSKSIPGALWVGVAFTGALALGRLYDREREGGMLSALLCSPVDLLALYLAKVMFGTVLLTICALIYLPGLAFMMQGGGALLSAWPTATLILVLGCFGYSAIAALFAAALARDGAKSLVLSMILYPISTPVLLTALVATQRLIEGDSGVSTAIAQLAAIVVALFALACFLFESMLAPGRTAAKNEPASSPQERSSPSRP